MARSKRCLCTDCKPAMEKSALELIMFAKNSPEKNKPNKTHFEKSSKMAKNNREDEEEKKIKAKLEPLRSEVKELFAKKGIGKENSIPGKNISLPQILAGKPDFENLLTPDCKHICELIRSQKIRPIVAYHKFIFREQIKQFNEEVKKQKANEKCNSL